MFIAGVLCIGCGAQVYLIFDIYYLWCLCADFYYLSAWCWLFVCCLYKEVYLQIFKCASFCLQGCCGKWESWVRKPVSHTSLVTVATPIDNPKSVCNRCVIEHFVALFVLWLCPVDISVCIGDFVIGLRSLPFSLDSQSYLIILYSVSLCVR